MNHWGDQVGTGGQPALLACARELSETFDKATGINPSFLTTGERRPRSVPTRVWSHVPKESWPGRSRSPATSPRSPALGTWPTGTPPKPGWTTTPPPRSSASRKPSTSTTPTSNKHSSRAACRGSRPGSWHSVWTTCPSNSVRSCWSRPRPTSSTKPQPSAPGSCGSWSARSSKSWPPTPGTTSNAAPSKPRNDAPPSRPPPGSAPTATAAPASPTPCPTPPPTDSAPTSKQEPHPATEPGLDHPDAALPYPQRLGNAFVELLENLPAEVHPIHGGTATRDHHHDPGRAPQRRARDPGQRRPHQPRRSHEDWRARPGSSPPSSTDDPRSWIWAAPRGCSTPPSAKRWASATAAAAPKAAPSQHPGAKPTTPKNPGPDGGRTDLKDGALLCNRHHHHAHDPRYQTTRLPNGDFRFHRRT